MVDANPTIHRLVNPLTKATQKEPGETADVSNLQQEQLARICYSLLRSHLNLTQEAYMGSAYSQMPWIDTCFWTSNETQQESSTRSTVSLISDLDAQLLALDHNVQALVQEICYLLQQRITEEHERLFSSSFNRLSW
jgi:hypothetical protein